MKRYFFMSIVAAMTVVGCTTDPVSLGKTTTSDDDNKEAWSWRDTPEQLAENVVYKLDDLPLNAQVPDGTVWAADYYSLQKGGLLYRWQDPGQTSSEDPNTFSPAEKYDLAFNNWQPPANFAELHPLESPGAATDRGHDYYDEYYDSLGPFATWWAENYSDQLLRDGLDNDDNGVIDDPPEVASWQGLCHAWAPAAIMVPQPLHAVEVNGVTFELGDIEALIMAAWHRTGNVAFGAQRCNKLDAEPSENETYVVEREPGTDRPTDMVCRDSNLGTLVLLLTNMIGIQQTSFIADVTFDRQVWNHPVRDYDLEAKEVSEAEATEYLGVDSPTGEYPYNDEATQFRQIDLTVRYVIETRVDKTPDNGEDHLSTRRIRGILELNDDGEIIGGEYAWNLGSEAFDFVWTADNPRGAGGIMPAHVEELVRLSREPEAPAPGGDVLTATAAPALDIPDNNPNGVSHVLQVAGAGEVTGGVSVALDISHTYRGDLAVFLEKDGVRKTVTANTGGSANDIKETFVVNGFDGMTAAGGWTISVVDSYGADTGSLDNVTITINTGGGDASGATETSFAAMTASIPDNDANGVSINIDIPAGTVCYGATLQVVAQHTWIGDLNVEARFGPTGQTWAVHNNEGGGTANFSKFVKLEGLDPNNAGGQLSILAVDNAQRDTGTIAASLKCYDQPVD